MAIAAERKVIYTTETVTATQEDPINDLMITHHRAFMDAVTSFKLEFGREPNYAEVTVKYDVYLGLLSLELIEEIQHQ